MNMYTMNITTASFAQTIRFYITQPPIGTATGNTKATLNSVRTVPKERSAHKSKSCQKTVMRHVWADYLDIAEDFRYTPRGKSKVTMQALLTFACMNLKKLAIWKSRDPRFRPESDFSMPQGAAARRQVRPYAVDAINCVRRNLFSYYGNKTMRKQKWGSICLITIKNCLQD